MAAAARRAAIEKGKLGLAEVTALGIGGMIGGGIFSVLGVVVDGVRVVLGVTTGMVEVAAGAGWYSSAPAQAAKKTQTRADTVRRRIPTDGIGTCRSRLFTIMAYLVSLPADAEGAGERLHPG